MLEKMNDSKYHMINPIIYTESNDDEGAGWWTDIALDSLQIPSPTILFGVGLLWI